MHIGTVPVVRSGTHILGSLKVFLEGSGVLNHHSSLMNPPIWYKCTYGSVLVYTLMPTCPGVRGSAAHTGDGVDERNPGTAAVASLVPRHHRHEQVLYIIFNRVLDTSCIV